VTNLVVTPILRSVDTLSFRVDPSASTSTTGHSVAADRDLHFVLIPIAFVLPGSPSGTDPTDPCPTRGCMAVYQAHSDDDKLLGKQFFRFGTQRSPRIFACSTRGQTRGQNVGPSRKLCCSGDNLSLSPRTDGDPRVSTPRARPVATNGRRNSSEERRLCAHGGRSGEAMHFPKADAHISHRYSRSGWITDL
jgi:hypothetical protein